MTGFPFSFLSLWIPHLKKLSVSYLPRDADPSDPPLTDGAKVEARNLYYQMRGRYPVSAIFTSLKRRALQTAEPAIEDVNNGRCGDIPIISLNTLGQPDNGDLDPGNPDAEIDGPLKGWMIYGKRSTTDDWWKWFRTSMLYITIAAENAPLIPEPVIWVYTHRPLVACARLAAEAEAKGEHHQLVNTTVLTSMALDKSLLPFMVLRHTRMAGGGYHLKELQCPAICK